MKSLTKTIVLWSSLLIPFSGYSQWGGTTYAPSNWDNLGTGFLTGYSKTNDTTFSIIGQNRGICSGSNHSIALDTALCGAYHGMLILFPADSSMNSAIFNSHGPYDPGGFGAEHTFERAVLVDKNCIDCHRYSPIAGYEHFRKSYMENYHEYVADSFYSTTVDTNYKHFSFPMSYNDGIIYENGGDPLGDSLGNFLKNIVPPMSLPYTIGKPLLVAVQTARIFRFHDYPSVTSPWQGNQQVIMAIKGKPSTWNPGFVDREGDSIVVEPLNLPITLTMFHPSYYYYLDGSPMDTWFQDLARPMFQDSLTTNLTYQPGYSASQPFGTSSAYSLDPATGAISYTPADSGLYYLTYKITEYRDGLPLGEITSTRLAWVLDSNVTMPTVSGPNLINFTPAGAGSYDATTGKFSMCQGATVSFQMKVETTLADGQIVLKQGFTTSLPGAVSVTTTGENTDSAVMNVNWTAPTTTGLYYTYFDWADTACGPNHMPIHQSTGFQFSIGGCSVGIDDQTVQNSNDLMLVYPNPAKGDGTVRIKSNGTIQLRYQIEVTDALGRTVEMFSMQSASEAHFGSNLAPGVYIISATDSKGERMIQKWCKQ